MPFFRKKSEKRRNEKLEHQLYLAKFEPSNVVDLSECDLDVIPSETYSLCHLFLKEVLILRSNRLKNLNQDESLDVVSSTEKLLTLRVLDLRNNLICTLPREIEFLKNLQILNLENNQLLEIGKELCTLINLQTLNLRANKLKSLPDQIGNLQSLRMLDISKNSIYRLPTSICKLGCLETMILDIDDMLYPTRDVCSQGTNEILKYICADNNVVYVPASIKIVSLLNNPTKSCNSNYYDSSPNQAKLSTNFSYENFAPNSAKNLDNSTIFLDQYESLKEQKKQEMLNLHRSLLNEQEKEAKLVANVKAQKALDLAKIEKENSEITYKLDDVVKRHEEANRRVRQELLQSEKATKTLIDKLYSEHEEAKRKDLLASSQALKLAEEEALKLKLADYERLRKTEIQDAMQAQIRELYMIENVQKVNDFKRQKAINEFIETESYLSENLDNLLKFKQKETEKVVQSVVVDEKLQKKALLILMEQKDERTNRINNQLKTIYDELLKLSAAEMTNRDKRDQTVQQHLLNQRNDLIQILNILELERTNRNEEMKYKLKQMELQREKEQTDYWLVQYQRLLDIKPNLVSSMEKSLDDQVVRLLEKAKATIYLPTFAKQNVTMNYLKDHATEESLIELGVHDSRLVAQILAILRDAAEFTKMSHDSDFGNSDQISLIKMRQEIECVICMDRKSCIVLLPCGHVCCCAICENKCLQCPLCRQKVERKIDLQTLVCSFNSAA